MFNWLRRLLNRVSVLMQYGYASSFFIDLYEKGVISKSEMLRKLDELDEKFKYNNYNNSG